MQDQQRIQGQKVLQEAIDAGLEFLVNISKSEKGEIKEPRPPRIDIGMQGGKPNGKPNFGPKGKPIGNPNGHPNKDPSNNNLRNPVNLGEESEQTQQSSYPIKQK